MPFYRSSIITSGGGQTGGTDVYIDGTKSSASELRLNSLIKQPYEFRGASAILFNGELHVLGGFTSDTYKNHYKYNGTSWVSVSTLPFEAKSSAVVVYNNELHLLSSAYFASNAYTHATKHYKWNGISWTSVSILPYDAHQCGIVVYNNEIHIIGGINDTQKHYKWNGTSWTSVSTLPIVYASSAAVVYNNEIHIIANVFASHYKWNGSSWTSVSTPPTTDVYNAVVYNNEIHTLSFDSHYKWNGTSWTECSSTLMSHYFYSSIVLNNKIVSISNSAVYQNICEVIDAQYYSVE